MTGIGFDADIRRWRGTYLPVWQPTLAGVRVCDLALLAAPEAEVAAAVRQHAGGRFDPARAPR